MKMEKKIECEIQSRASSQQKDIHQNEQAMDNAGH